MKYIFCVIVTVFLLSSCAVKTQAVVPPQWIVTKEVTRTDVNKNVLFIETTRQPAPPESTWYDWLFDKVVDAAKEQVGL